MDEARELLHVLDRGRWVNAVAEIEDVTGAPTHTLQDIAGAIEQPVHGTKEHHRIQIPLYRPVIADPRPRFIDRLPPVDADDITTGFGEVRQDGAGADAEMNQR